MRRALGLFSVGFLVLAAACDDDGPTPPIEEPDLAIRCQTSAECPAGEVCRDSLCRPAPECEDISECEPGENCTDEHCAYDPDVCASDNDCDLDSNEICDTGTCREGCRTDAACDEIERCSEEWVCVRRPCTEVPCDDRHECIEETGECQLLPCNGGCEEPLRCREEDDVCVECFLEEECDIGQFCDDDGMCAQQACEAHEDCPEGTFCILDFCERPPECEDDNLEPNDEYGSGTILPEGTHSGFTSCPYNDDYHQVVADGDHSLTVEVRYPYEDGNIDLELFNTVGVTFARRASPDGGIESLTVNTFKTGIYSVRVYQPDGGTLGIEYELFIETGQPVEVAPDRCLVDGFEPNDEPSQATRLFTGRWTGPTICAGDHDYYTLPLEAGEFFRVCLTPSELFGVPLGLELLYSNGSELLSDAGLTQFCLEEDLLQGDDYLAHVFGLTEEAEAAYHIEFFIDPGCRLFDDEYGNNQLPSELPLVEIPPDMATLPPDTPTLLRVCPNAPDYWPVDLLSGDQLTATIDFCEEEAEGGEECLSWPDLQMRLRRPNGTVILSSTGSTDRETINYQAEQDGIHFIQIYGEGRSMGDYTFTYSVDPAE